MPSIFSRISSKYHAGNNGLAAYWLNNIEVVMDSLEPAAPEMPDYERLLRSEFEKIKGIVSEPTEEELEKY